MYLLLGIDFFDYTIVLLSLTDVAFNIIQCSTISQVSQAPGYQRLKNLEIRLLLICREILDDSPTG